MPALEGGTAQLLAHSLAVLKWLEKTYPMPPLLPPDSADAHPRRQPGAPAG